MPKAVVCFNEYFVLWDLEYGNTAQNPTANSARSRPSEKSHVPNGNLRAAKRASLFAS